MIIHMTEPKREAGRIDMKGKENVFKKKRE